jgi:hypothetical protein
MKNILLSKTFWFNILTIATVVAAAQGYTPDQGLADKVASLMIVANPIVNIVLRYFTHKAVTILPTNSVE